MKTIDLDKYRSRMGQTVSRVFTGRDRGEYVRDSSKINSIYNGEEDVTIVIPDDIFSITPSFLEEFFRVIVVRYGKVNVKEHIKFQGKYKINTAFNEAVDRIVQKRTGLE